MFERFTDRARRVVVLAQEEAKGLDHNYIGTEHILLGLIHEGEGVAALALAELGVTLDTAREQLLAIVKQGDYHPTGHIPFTPRAKNVFELSLRETLRLGTAYISTEHHLLAIIRENDRKDHENDTAIKLLRRLNVDLGELESAVYRVMRISPVVDEAKSVPSGRIRSIDINHPSIKGAAALQLADSKLGISIFGVREGHQIQVVNITMLVSDPFGKTRTVTLRPLDFRAGAKNKK